MYIVSNDNTKFYIRNIKDSEYLENIGKNDEIKINFSDVSIRILAEYLNNDEKSNYYIEPTEELLSLTYFMKLDSLFSILVDNIKFKIPKNLNLNDMADYNVHYSDKKKLIKRLFSYPDDNNVEYFKSLLPSEIYFLCTYFVKNNTQILDHILDNYLLEPEYIWYFSEYIVKSNRIELLKETSHHHLKFIKIEERNNILSKFLKSVCIVGHMEDINYALTIYEDYIGGFYASCEGGHIDTAMMFAKLGNIPLEHGFSDFCKTNNTVIVESIITEYNITTLNYINGLVAAFYHGAYDVVYLLLNKYSGLYKHIPEGFDIWIYEQFITDVCMKGNGNILRLFSDRLLNIHQINKSLFIHLCRIAFINNYTDILDFFMENNITYDYNEDFYNIVRSANINVIKMIIKQNRISGKEIAYIPFFEVLFIFKFYDIRAINFIIDNCEDLITKDDMERLKDMFKIDHLKDIYNKKHLEDKNSINFNDIKKIINIYDLCIDNKYPNLDQDVKKYIISYIL